MPVTFTHFLRAGSHWIDQQPVSLNSFPVRGTYTGLVSKRIGRLTSTIVGAGVPDWQAIAVG